MAEIFIKRNGARFDVTVYRGLSATKTTTFDLHAAAMAFADSKLGKRSGFIVDQTKVADHRASDEAA